MLNVPLTISMFPFVESASLLDFIASPKELIVIVDESIFIESLLLIPSSFESIFILALLIFKSSLHTIASPIVDDTSREPFLYYK